MKESLLNTKKIILIFSLLFCIVFSIAVLSAAAAESDFEYKITGSEAALIKYSGSSEELVIPSETDSFDVCTIGDGYEQIARKDLLEYVSVPDSVRLISDYAFFEMKNLKNVVLGNSVETIGRYAFDGCTSLAYISIPDSVSEIGSYSFSGDKNLEYIRLGDNVKTIGENAFYNCGTESGGLIIFCREGSDTYKTLSETVPELTIMPYEDYDIFLHESTSSTETNQSSEITKKTETTAAAVSETVSAAVTSVSDTAAASSSTAANVSSAASVTPTSVTSVTAVSSQITQQTADTKISNDENDILGDVNLDKKIDSKDATEILKYYANKIIGKKYEIKCRIQMADINSDRRVNSKDASIILKFYAGSILGKKKTLSDYA